MAHARATVIALVGAESTGKTALSLALGEALRAVGSVAVVPEYLREFCDRHQRTPRRDEQALIAAEQSRRIEAAARDHALVIADTTALMTAVYSDWVFGDPELYEIALRDHARADHTLLMGLDLPWQPDGLQRDGPHVRAAIDQRVRAALARAGTAYTLIYGVGAQRLQAALTSVRHVRLGPDASSDGASRWHWHCERCGDPRCERRLLARPPAADAPR